MSGAGALGPQYRKLLAGSAVSNLGDGVSFVAVPLLAATLTQRPELVAGLSFAYTLPRLLVTFFSGVAADRLDRRRLMVAVNAVRGSLLGGLAVLVALGLASIWLLYGIFVVLGLFETLADVSAFTVLPMVVEPDRLDRANGQLAGAQTICDEIAGPPLGGLLFGVAAALPLLLDASSFVLAATFFLWMKGDFHPRLDHDKPAQPAGVVEEIVVGMRYLGGHRTLLSLAVMSLITNFAYMLPFSVLVLYATRTLGLSSAGYGLVLTISAAGSLAGSAAAPAIRRLLGVRVTVRGTLLLGAAAYLVLALTRSVVLVTVLLAAYFLYTSVWTITVTSVRQSLIPRQLLGRVSGVTRSFSLLGLLLGSVAGGLVAGGFGLRAPFWCAAALLALSALLPLGQSVDRAPVTPVPLESDEAGQLL